MGSGINVIKICFAAVNVILAAFAIAGITWVSINPNVMHREAAIGVYVVGVLIILFAILSCWATKRESIFLTVICALFLIVLAVIHIVFITVDVKHGGGIRSGDSDVKLVQREWQTERMHDLETEYKCCGKTGSNDYILLHEPLPKSCYANQDMSSIGNLYNEGCIAKLQKYNDEDWWRFSIFSWVFIAIELIGFLLALFLVINFRHTQRHMHL